MPKKGPSFDRSFSFNFRIYLFYKPQMEIKIIILYGRFKQFSKHFSQNSRHVIIPSFTMLWQNLEAAKKNNLTWKKNLKKKNWKNFNKFFFLILLRNRNVSQHFFNIYNYGVDFYEIIYSFVLKLNRNNRCTFPFHIISKQMTQIFFPY